MKVTLKVKHIVTGGLSIGIVLCVLFLFVIPKLQVVNAQKNYEQGKGNGKANLLAIINHPPSESKKWELIRKYMIQTDPISIVHSFNVFVGPSSTMTQGSGSEVGSESWTWEEKLPYLEAYLSEGPTDGQFLVSAARQLAYYYSSEGRVDQALAAIALAEKRRVNKNNNELKLEQVKLYIDNNELDKAKQVLNEWSHQPVSHNVDINGEAVKLWMKILIQEGDPDRALEKVSQELDALRKTLADNKKLSPEMENPVPMALEQLTSLKANLENFINHNGHSTSTVSGTITKSDGTPMKRVGVYLRASKDVNRSVTEGEPYQTLTDAKGHYEFKGVLPGSYQLHLGLLFEQIDGWTWPTTNWDWIDVGQSQSLSENVVLKPLITIQSPINKQAITGDTMKFQWELVEGAAYYNLNVNLPMGNGTMGSTLQEYIRHNYLELPIEQLYDKSTGISFKDVGDTLVPDEATLLGFANPNSQFSWSVEAFDEQGRPISKSNGYRLNENTIGDLPFFYLKSRSLTEADQLLLDEKVDEALAAYKRSYSSNNQDRHSLRMIIRIYEAQASSSPKISSSEQAIPYIKEMVKLKSSGEYLYRLFHYYYEQKDWTQVNQYYKLISQENEGQVDSYTRSIYATALMNQSRLKEAAEQFDLAMREDRSHRFIGNYLAVVLHDTKTFDAAIQLASEYPERSFGESTPVWLDLIKGLESEAATFGVPEYFKELQEKLELYYNGDKKSIDSWAVTTKLTRMRNFIKSLFEVN
ncbi:carboxypeptidase-like regulatory domain-containing protein [Cohnella abietis]|uniref:Carboxypeptidase regulatory-like domain-containing protein n=1 Tax=Cohnella abietis TaxID=2507935 RepID=A0A3T1D0X5_9BACL|nr:carboxypeptidase-like regulatory domain-containing protein [Cohnella abietis]BBI31659.1 hypothetical protein KCTCHS21_10580 [Cohnella abietis]